MAALPVATDFTGSSIQEGQFKTAITNQREFLAGLLGTTGTQAAAQAALQAMFGAGVRDTPSSYTLTTADRGKVLYAYNNITITLPAAATAGNGYAVAIRNIGGGTVVVDANASELVNGALAIALAPGDSAIVVCSGFVWITIGNTNVSYPISLANGGTGATTAAASRAALGVVAQDQGYNAVGSLCFCAYTNSSSKSPDGTTSGTNLKPVGLKFLKNSEGEHGQVIPSYGSAMTGTWRLLGNAPSGSSSTDPTFAIWQKIAA